MTDNGVDAYLSAITVTHRVRHQPIKAEPGCWRPYNVSSPLCGIMHKKTTTRLASRILAGILSVILADTDSTIQDPDKPIQDPE